MKRGINGDIINEKLNIMAGPNLKNRLWITEFDVENKDIDFRTEDVKLGFQTRKEISMKFILRIKIETDQRILCAQSLLIQTQKP